MPLGRCSGVKSAVWKQFKQKNSLENRAESTSSVCSISCTQVHIDRKSPEQPKISLNGRPNGLVWANSAWNGRLMMLICSNLQAHHLILGDILPTQIPTNHYKSWTVSSEGQVMRPTSIHCKRSFWTYSVTCWQSSWTSWHIHKSQMVPFEAPGSTQKYWHNSKMCWVCRADLSILFLGNPLLLFNKTSDHQWPLTQQSYHLVTCWKTFQHLSRCPTAWVLDSMVKARITIPMCYDEIVPGKKTSWLVVASVILCTPEPGSWTQKTCPAFHTLVAELTSMLSETLLCEVETKHQLNTHAHRLSGNPFFNFPCSFEDLVDFHQILQPQNARYIRSVQAKLPNLLHEREIQPSLTNELHSSVPRSLWFYGPTQGPDDHLLATVSWEWRSIQKKKIRKFFPTSR